MKPKSPLPERNRLDEASAIQALAALAQAQRLRAFRALVVAGANGLTPGVIAERLALAPSALSFHLKELAHAGLVSCESRGRHLIYRANFARMADLMGYMSEHCCQGQSATPAPTPAPACCASSIENQTPSRLAA